MLKNYSTIFLFTIIFIVSGVFFANSEDYSNSAIVVSELPKDSTSAPRLNKIDKLVQKMYFVTTDIFTSDDYETEISNISENKNEEDNNQLVEATGDADENDGFLGALEITGKVNDAFSVIEDVDLEFSDEPRKTSDDLFDEDPLEEVTDSSLEKFRVNNGSAKVSEKDENVVIDGTEEKIKKEGSKDNSIIKDPVKRPNKDFRNVRLPSLISKKKYNKDNSHLPPVVYESEYKKILFNSVLSENLDVMRAMIKRLGSTEIRDGDGNTPLIYAIIANKFSAVKVLIGMGAQINTANYTGTSPLYIAIKNNRRDFISYLIARGGDVNLTDVNGNNLLMSVVESNNAEIVRLLINAGCDVNYMMKDGNSAIHFSAKNNSVQVTTLLIEAGSNLDGINFEGYTPLMLAAANGAIDVVNLLIYANADLSITDANGNDAAKLADLNNHYKISAMLASAHANSVQEAKLTRKPLFSIKDEVLAKIPIPVKKPVFLPNPQLTKDESNKMPIAADIPIPQFTAEEKSKM